LVKLVDIKLFNDFTLNLMNKNVYFKRRNDMFSFVGLMLSRICYGNCIFCPISRLQHQSISSGKKMFMSLEVVEKVVKDLGSMSFSGWINLGENGDALLNPNFKDIVKMISQNLPSAKIMVYTNMARMDKELSYFVMKHNLSRLCVNIDGSTKETYEFAKQGLKYNTIKENLLNLIKIRNQTGGNCNVSIFVIPPKRYMTLRANTKISIPYDVLDIVDFWKPYLLKGDSILEVKYFWNWNGKFSNQVRKKSCPMVPSLLNSCYISTEGDVYACCLDSLTKLTFGNILEIPIEKIWKGKKRRDVVRNIVNKEFEKVGEPCIYCNEKNDFLASYLNYIGCQLGSRFKRLFRKFRQNSAHSV
jgi:radical SAM protein with 4Fe4S-binding SPASM domain